MNSPSTRDRLEANPTSKITIWGSKQFLAVHLRLTAINFGTHDVHDLVYNPTWWVKIEFDVPKTFEVSGYFFEVNGYKVFCTQHVCEVV